MIMPSAPAERDVSGKLCVGPFRSAGARRYLGASGPINISSLQDEEPAKTILLRKQEVAGLGTVRL